MQALKSRTIRVMVAMGGLEAALAVSHTWQPLMSDNHYILVGSILGILTPMLGVYMRLITTQPVSEK